MPSSRCCRRSRPISRRPTLDRGPGRAGRDHLCAASRGALAAAARPRSGLRQRRDLLAAAAPLASRRVWEALHHRLLDWLGDDGQVDWSRAAVDSVSVRARRGGTDRRQSGRPGQGWLQVPPAGRRRRDPAGGRAVGRQHPRLAAVGAAGGRGPGRHRPAGTARRPRKRPAKLHADKGYDFPGCRRLLRRRGICPRIARRGVESSARLGRHRWKVERSLAWLVANRRLTVCYERRADVLTALLHLACALICAGKLRPL